MAFISGNVSDILHRQFLALRQYAQVHFIVHITAVV